jgi:hypothetical protein
VSKAEQIRRGIRLWLESKGVMKKARSDRRLADLENTAGDERT